MKKQTRMQNQKCWPSSVCSLWMVIALSLLGVTTVGAQSVKGKVRGSDGYPVIGANVVEKGTTNGTITDIDGNYALILTSDPAKAVLEFSYIGYIPGSAVVGSKSVLDITLTEDIQKLEEVVVIGYGTQRRKDVTGSVASVSNKELGVQPNLTFTQSLQGKVAGVQVQQTSGAPGGNVNILIRGASSINGGNQPLYVVDGFPIGSGGGGSNLSTFTSSSYSSSGMANTTQNKIDPLSSINPADIESIEILKDASATAIYGSRGANGVVIITTKRGKAGKTTVDVNASFGIQHVANKLEMLNARQFADFVREGRDNAWLYLNPNNKITDPNEYRAANGGQSTQVKPEFRNPSSLTLPGTDWQDVIFRAAPVQNYQLSATGGTENIRYMVSGGYFNQQGIILGSDYQRFNIRTNIDANLTSWLKLGASVAGSYGYGRFARAEGHLQYRGMINCALAGSPTIPVYDENGNPMNELTNPLGVPVENPINIDRNFDDKRAMTDIFTNNYLEFKILDGLTLKTSIGLTYNSGDTRLWKSSLIATGQGTSSPATAAVINKIGLNWLNENTLTYRKLFNRVHDLNVVAGFTSQKDTYKQLSAGATNFPNDYIHYLGAGTINAGTDYKQEWSLMSLLARANYIYAGKYMVTATVRRDGSSRFGSQTKWGTFPSISLAYRLSEEEFMKKLPFISNLKARVSYGVAGNNQIGNYAHIGLIGVSNYAYNNALVPGLVPSSLSNDRLTWEKSKQFNVGLDLGFFNDRLAITADYYHDLKTDLLLNVELPAASGFTSSTQNVGEVLNQGVEVGINSINIQNKNFQWSTSFNISSNANKVTKLATKGGRITNSSWQVSEVGRPISSFYMLKVLGVFQNADDVANNPKQAPNVQPGDLKFFNANGDEKIDMNDRTFVGSPWPDFTWGMTNNFTYKNITLSVFVNGTQGNSVYFLGGETILNSAGVQNQLALVDRRWKSESDPGDGLVPRAIRNDYAKGMASSSRYLFDGSFVRIKDITLSYDFPKQTIKKIGMQGLNVYANVSNAFLFTNYPSYDPEASISGDNVSMTGIDDSVYPTPRTFSVGLKVAF